MSLSKSDQNLLAQLNALVSEETEVKAVLQIKQLERIKKALAKDTSQKKRKRGSQSTKETSRVKLIAKDTVTIAGLTGTLGNNLFRIVDEFEITSARSKCYSFFCKNGIADISDNGPKNLQSNLLGSHVNNFLNSKYKHKLGCGSDPNIKILEKNFKKVKNKSTAKSAYRIVEDFHYRSDEERIIKRIYSQILYQHCFCYHLFAPETLKAYSEQSYIVKFWGCLFESYFCERNDVILQWGDTISKSCKQSSLSFRLDLRIIASTNYYDVDIGNAEFAKQAATNESKYYRDKLKAVLAAKNHLNYIITNTKHLPPQAIRNIFLPVLQIMGMSCHMYVLSLIDKGLYLLQKVYTMSYPITNHQIKNGTIQNIVRGLALVEDIVQNTVDVHNEYNQDTEDIILKKITMKKRHQISNKHWTSPVIQPESDDDDEEKEYDDEDADDEEEDDDEDEDVEVEDEDGEEQEEEYEDDKEDDKEAGEEKEEQNDDDDDIGLD